MVAIIKINLHQIRLTPGTFGLRMKSLIILKISFKEMENFSNIYFVALTLPEKLRNNSSSPLARFNNLVPERYLN